jgi:tol-pal system protein YbgF
MKNNALIFLLIVMVLCSCATQRDVVTLDDQVVLMEQKYVELKKKNKELESRLEAYSKEQKKSDSAFRGQSANRHVMIDELRDEMATLSGKIEETEYLINREMKTIRDSNEKGETRLAGIEKATNFNSERILRLEQYLNFETETTKDKKPSPDYGKTLSEDKIYRLAKQAFDQGNFEQAREGFLKLINKYPNSKNADNAQFWIGETYYREKWYEKAILEYQKAIEKYPKGNKVQSSLLKQGFAFYNIGDKTNSRLILKELIKKYPRSNEAKIAKRKLKGFTP